MTLKASTLYLAPRKAAPNPSCPWTWHFGNTTVGAKGVPMNDVVPHVSLLSGLKQWVIPQDDVGETVGLSSPPSNILFDD